MPAPKSKKTTSRRTTAFPQLEVPPAHDWRTTDQDEINRRKLRYAFVLTGTPIENRIDELHSLMDFLNPEVLGPLFRFNRDFYSLDERGRPDGYRNLDRLHARVAPYMIRRRKADVETELPGRTDHVRFVEMSSAQRTAYEDHEVTAKRLLAEARKRPLRKSELDLLQLKLACMRMVCDTNYILDQDDSHCPKLAELEGILEDAASNDAKVIVFSEWERMLMLVRELCRKLDLGFAWHTGRVPQKKRRGEINAFKQDPDCRVFLSTDSGSTGLNLQNASIVVNCDLPWNPAKLEQRIARAWRKNQTQAVTVYNLVSENSIEHQMLDTLANKQSLSDGVLDGIGNLNEIKLRGGRQAFVERLQQMVSPGPARNQPAPHGTSQPTDLPKAFAERVESAINGALLQCEERFPAEGDHTVLLVVTSDIHKHSNRIKTIHQELFPDTPESPVRLEIIDPSTAEALARLEAAGIYAPTFRSSRPLHPNQSAPDKNPPALTAGEKKRIEDNLSNAGRNLKMARVLGESGFTAEARPPLLEAIRQIGGAVAIQNHLPSPRQPADCLRPPMSAHWKEQLSTLDQFLRDENAPVTPIITLLTNTASSCRP